MSRILPSDRTRAFEVTDRWLSKPCHDQNEREAVCFLHVRLHLHCQPDCDVIRYQGGLHHVVRHWVKGICEISHACSKLLGVFYVSRRRRQWVTGRPCNIHWTGYYSTWITSFWCTKYGTRSNDVTSPTHTHTQRDKDIAASQLILFATACKNTSYRKAKYIQQRSGKNLCMKQSKNVRKQTGVPNIMKRNNDE